MKPEYLRTGFILGTFGLKGHLRVKIISDFPERFEEGSQIFININGFYKEHLIKECTLMKGRLVRLLLSGFDNAQDAASYSGLEIFVPYSEVESNLDFEDSDTYHYSQIIGMSALYKGNSFGSVKDIADIGGGSTLVIEFNGKEYFVPFVESMVEVDAENSLLNLTPPDGLIESQ